MKLYPKTNNFLWGTLPIMEKEERVISSSTSQEYRWLSLISQEQTWEIGSARLKFNEKRRRGEPGQWMFYHTSNNGLHLHRQLTIVCTIHAIYCNHFFTFRGKPFEEDNPVRISKLLAFQSWTSCYIVHWFPKSLNRLWLKPLRLKIANIQNNYWHSHFSSRFSAYIYNSLTIIIIMSFKVQFNP